MKRKHLSKAERLEIYILKKKGYSYRSIADAIGRNVSTVSKEIERNSVMSKKSREKEYKPISAERKSYYRRRYAKTQFKKIISNYELRNYIDKHLQKYWSPEQIAGRWNEKHKNIQISYLTIYKYVYSAQGQKFYEYLYSKRYKPKKRTKNKTKREMIQNRTWIDDRPRAINEREEVGHFEGDLIVSRKGEKSVLLTTIERKSRLLLVEKLENKRPSSIEIKIKKIQRKIDIRSLTLDNGIEFKNHQNYNCNTYFCHPYSSWEKGQIEYANRLIRRFIPKKSNIADYSEIYIQKIVSIINNTPRKCLNYKTPIEAYLEYSSKQKLKP